MKKKTRYTLTSILYLVGFPILGGGFGIIFTWILELVNGEVSLLGYRISVIVWGDFGLYAGICGFIPLRKIHLTYKIHAPRK